ncbi:MAG: hypothetical protein JNG89_20520 [Planctomycetaceae bacterium]|nr:hypothetical protein [Planctomycetaceae bacterium]
MTPIRQLSPRDKSLEVARWIAVLPAAALGNFTVDFVFRLVSGIAQPLWFLQYLLAPVAFVFTGSYVAPRHKTGTAVSLSMTSAGISLLKHVVGPHLAGNRVGTTNYVHAGLELAGALAGVTLLILRGRQSSDATDQ